jgi:hypothetical protein
MSRLLIVLLVTGCTQTAHTTNPLTVSCEITCKPGVECYGKFEGQGDTTIDQSVLLDEVDYE